MIISFLLYKHKIVVRQGLVGAIDLNRPGGSVNRPYLFDLCEDIRDSRVLPFWIYRKMLIFKVLRDALGLFRPDLFGRGVQRMVSFAAFPRATIV